MGELAARVRERAHVSGAEPDGTVCRQPRPSRSKRLAVARQDYDSRPEMMSGVGPEEALQQPGAEKPRPAREKQARTAQVLPPRAYPFYHMVKIFSQRVGYAHRGLPAQ